MLDAMVSFLWAEGMSGFTRVGDEDNIPPNLASNWVFKTTDGFITVSTITDVEWRTLCKLLEQEPWITDTRFNTPANRVRNRELQINLLSDIFST
jgi:crotonobetainyl-CoA:carnitine CoA-transferase CaiB-like acyl-CoA transferase